MEKIANQEAIEKINPEKYELEEFRKKVCERKLEKLNEMQCSAFLNELDSEYENLTEDLEELLNSYLLTVRQIL